MSRRRRQGKEPVPEALFDATKIDLVAISSDGDAAELVIVNDGPWTGYDAQVMSLQHKIHSYVGFALDGQMAETYPDTIGIAWRIVIADKAGPVDPRSADIIARVAAKVREHGGDLIVR